MIIDKDNIKILLILLVVGLGIGYAYINSDLKINGTAQINHANWDVHWANVQVKSGSVSAATPTITNQTTVNYSVTLTNPGDYYEFTVDAVNGGEIDAMIDTISSKLNGTKITTLPEYLSYSVVYADDEELEENHQLLANTTEKYKVSISYRDDINASQLPTTNQTLNLSFTVVYRQATENAISKPVFLYRGNVHTSNLGDTVSDGDYDEYSDLVDNENVFIRQKVDSNGVIVKTDLGFVYNDNIYYLNGGGATYNQGNDSYADDSQYYENNKKILKNAFGSDKCSEKNSEFGYGYTCNDGIWQAFASKQGLVVSEIGSYQCFINADQSSGCDGCTGIC